MFIFSSAKPSKTRSIQHKHFCKYLTKSKYLIKMFWLCVYVFKIIERETEHLYCKCVNSRIQVTLCRCLYFLASVICIIMYFMVIWMAALCL